MKRKSKIDCDQFPLFELLHVPPGGNVIGIGRKVRLAVSEAIRKSGKDRKDICLEIYRLTDIEVSKHTLDSWSAEGRDRASDNEDLNGNKRWGMPAEIVPAFCQITGDWEVLFIQAEAGHYTALKGKDVIRARLGLVKEEIAKKQKEAKELEHALLKDKEE